jgi:ATP-binding cassette subfamily B protein
LQHELRVDTYNHLQELDLAYFEDRSTGTLLSILNDDINQLERFLNFGAQDLISFFTRVFAVGISFVLLAPGLAWFAMVPIPFILWGTFLFQARLAPRYDTVRDQAGLISDRLSNNLAGIATIKSFTAEAYESNRVYQESEAYRRNTEGDRPQCCVSTADSVSHPVGIRDDVVSRWSRGPSGSAHGRHLWFHGVHRPRPAVALH